MKKVRLTLIICSLALLGFPFNLTIEKSFTLNSLKIGITEAYASDCPNGCLTTLGTCYCRGTHAYEEKDWGDEDQ